MARGLLEATAAPDVEAPSGDGAVASCGAAGAKTASPSKHPRLASLDIVRGFTMAVMIFVDDVGSAYPPVNHSPWDNVTMADFVMPWFLFMAGVSMSISLAKFKGARRDRMNGTHLVAVRSLKLFCLGVILQGGGWIGNYSYGYNLSVIRVPGILQRIGFAFFVAALVDLWVPQVRISGGWSPHAAVFGRHSLQWLVAFTFVALHLALTFLTFVPSWTSKWGWNATASDSVLLQQPFEVKCDVRGSIDGPACSAVGFFDRLLFGQDHLGAWMSTRLPECSSCAPGGPDPTFHPNCGVPADAPRWCYAHIYDPEGALASLPAMMTVMIGAHFGRLLGSDGIGRGVGLLAHWSLCALVLIVAGIALHVGGLPMNKQLWSTSYLLFTAGTCGAALILTYLAVDNVRNGAAPPLRVRGCRLLLAPLEMMGMNAILVFFWHGTAEALLNAVYVAPPHAGGRFAARGGLEGDQGWIYLHALSFIPDLVVRQIVYVLLKIACFAVATWICYRKRYFWKI